MIAIARKVRSHRDLDQLEAAAIVADPLAWIIATHEVGHGVAAMLTAGVWGPFRQLELTRADRKWTGGVCWEAKAGDDATRLFRLAGGLAAERVIAGHLLTYEASVAGAAFDLARAREILGCDPLTSLRFQTATRLNTENVKRYRDSMVLTALALWEPPCTLAFAEFCELFDFGVRLP